MKRLFNKLLIISTLIFIMPFNVNAISQDTVGICEFSDEFINWSNLPEEEQKVTVMPKACKTDEVSELISKVTSESSLPVNNNVTASPSDSSYSLVDLKQVGESKDQGNTGACWTFSSTIAVESYFKKRNNLTYKLSPLHIEYGTSPNFTGGTNPYAYNRTTDAGGNFLMSSSYFANNQGAVYESSFPFATYQAGSIAHRSISYTTFKGVKPSFDVNDTMVHYYAYENGSSCSDNSAMIKSHLVNYGAVGTTVVMSASYQKSPYLTNITYNGKNYKQFYYGGAKNGSDHAVTIVGWDDNYPRTNFPSSNRPSKNGAWLVQNSWGTSWGYQGYFWVSYEDQYICDYTFGVYDADTEFPEVTYTNDPLGLVYNLGYFDTNSNGEKEIIKTAYAANVFTKSSGTEKLTEVTVGSDDYVTFDVYVVPNYKNESDLNYTTATFVGSKSTPYGGYATLKLDNPVYLTGTKYAIIVRYTSVGDYYPIGVSTKLSSGLFANTKSALGRSYISEYGKVFSDMYNNSSEFYVASIKGGTNKVSLSMASVNSELYSLKDTTFSSVITAKNLDGETLNYKVFNSSKEDVTSKFDISVGVITSNKATANIRLKENITGGTYTFTFYVGDNIASASIGVDLNHPYVTALSSLESVKMEKNSVYIVPDVVITPTFATNKSLTYSSNNTSVATVTSDGTVSAIGYGKATISVCAVDRGTVCTNFDVTVFRDELKNSSYYYNDEFIQGVGESTTIEDFENEFEFDSSVTNVELEDSNGNKKTEGRIGTGDVFKITRNESGEEITEDYTVIITGDLNGDGIANIVDVAKLYSYVTHTINLQSHFSLAGNCNGDNNTNIVDVAKLYSYVTHTIDVL